MSSGEVMVGGKRRQVQGQASQKPQKHLYLVLDDSAKTFSIHKIDADSPDLSDPPVVRLASPAPLQPMFFTALGSRILAVSSQHPATLVYDTDTAAVAAGPPLPDALHNAYVTFVPAAAGRLCAFGFYCRQRPPSVEVMSAATADGSSLVPSSDWSWRSVAPSPFAEDERIRSYAVHNDGRTVFVSTRSCSGGVRDDRGRSRTFSFDMSTSEWKLHGGWELPFEGQGFFDGDLDAWVGLHPDGYVGTCQVASRSRSRSGRAAEHEHEHERLDWKTARDRLWSKERQAAAGGEPTLTCMGGARFCLVECVEGAGFPHGCVLRLTTFRLRHSRNGELQVFDRSTSSCPVIKHSNSFSPVAFWM